MFDADERGLVDSVGSSTKVETDLDRLIERRDAERRRTEGERAVEELWAESVRRHHEREQLQLWWEWLRYHERMIRSHTANLEALISRHRAEAEKYASLLGVEPIDETTKRNGHKKGAA